jgi:hypothetical protein
MTADYFDRELTPEDVADLPDSPLRVLLRAGVQSITGAHQNELDKQFPVALTYLQSARQVGDGMFVLAVDMDYPDCSVADAVAGVANDVNTNPVLRDSLTGAVQDASYLASGVLYEGWAMPEGSPQLDDRRDPGDVPGAVAAEFVTVVMPDDTTFTVTHRLKGSTSVRVSALSASGAEPRTRTERIARAVQNLDRACQGAYAAKPESSPLDHIGQSATTAGGFSAELTGLEIGKVPGEAMTYAELSASPASPLRDVAVAAMDAETMHHDSYGWGSECTMVFRHRAHHTGGEPCQDTWLMLSSVPLSEQLKRLAGDLDDPESDTNRQAQRNDHACAYLGASVMSETIVQAGAPKGTQAAGDLPGKKNPDMRPVRLMLGVTRDNETFIVQRIRGEEPVVALGGVHTSVRLAGLLVANLLRLNAVLATLDPTPIAPVEPTAALTDVPAEKLELGGTALAVVIQWSSDEPRAGSIYPPLPDDHPYAIRSCACSKNLGDGTPVQTFTAVPADPGQIPSAFLDGSPRRAVAILLHQRCVTWVAAEFDARFHEQQAHTTRKQA